MKSKAHTNTKVQAAGQEAARAYTPFAALSPLPTEPARSLDADASPTGQADLPQHHVGGSFSEEAELVIDSLPKRQKDTVQACIMFIRKIGGSEIADIKGSLVMSAKKKLVEFKDKAKPHGQLLVTVDAV